MIIFHEGIGPFLRLSSHWRRQLFPFSDEVVNFILLLMKTDRIILSSGTEEEAMVGNRGIARATSKTTHLSETGFQASAFVMNSLAAAGF